MPGPSRAEFVAEFGAALAEFRASLHQLTDDEIQAGAKVLKKRLDGALIDFTVVGADPSLEEALAMEIDEHNRMVEPSARIPNTLREPMGFEMATPG